MTKVAPATLIELASSSGEHSAPVTHVLERIVLTVLVLAVFGGLCRLMWHGYQRRAVPTRPAVPPFTGVDIETGALVRV